MSKRMESAVRDFQLVEDRRQSLTYNVLSDEKVTTAIQEEPRRREPLDVLPYDRSQCLWQWQHRLAVDCFRSLKLPSPYRATDSQKPIVKIEVSHLEREDLASAKPRHGGNRKHHAVLALRCRNDGAGLVLSERWCLDLDVSLGQS